MSRRTPSPPPPAGPWTVVARTVIGVYIGVLILLLGYFIIGLWPVPRTDPASAAPPCPPLLSGPAATPAPQVAGPSPSPSPSPAPSPGASPAPAVSEVAAACPVSLFWGGLSFTITNEVRLILIALFVGALGSCIHAAGSFANFVGNREFVGTWTWWYFLKPLIGAPLALLFYFLIRGGLLTAFASSGDISPFGVAAFAGLVGLFSDPATLKLKEVFETLFKPRDERTDKLEPADRQAGEESNQGGDEAAVGARKPTIDELSPDPFPVGQATQLLTVRGRHFAPGTVAWVNGSERSIRVVNATELAVTLHAEDVATARQLELVVASPAGVSDVRTLTISPPA